MNTKGNKNKTRGLYISELKVGDKIFDDRTWISGTIEHISCFYVDEFRSGKRYKIVRMRDKDGETHDLEFYESGDDYKRDRTYMKVTERYAVTYEPGLDYIKVNKMYEIDWEDETSFIADRMYCRKGKDECAHLKFNGKWEIVEVKNN